MENINHITNLASGREASAVTSFSGQKGDQKGNFVLAETPEGANLGRDNIINNNDDAEGVSVTAKTSGMGMAGLPDESPSCNARQLRESTGKVCRQVRKQANAC
eukprot:2496044-Pleurochrysis_carterae.AAC.1